MLEWPIRYAWKAYAGASPPWVRIPPSPPALVLPKSSDVNILLPARLWFIMIGIDAVGFVLLFIGLTGGVTPLTAAGAALLASSTVLALLYRFRSGNSG